MEIIWNIMLSYPFEDNCDETIWRQVSLTDCVGIWIKMIIFCTELHIHCVELLAFSRHMSSSKQADQDGIISLIRVVSGKG